MSLPEPLLIGPYPFASVLLWIVVLLGLLYAARLPVHRVVHSVFRGLARLLRLGAHATRDLAERVTRRNEAILLAAGQEAAERAVERELRRVGDLAERQLGAYPDLHRRISAELTRIEEDHKASGEVPPEAPGWTEAVAAVAKLPGEADPMLTTVLEDVHASLVKAHDKALAEYRQATERRHKILERLRPHWQGMHQKVRRLETDVASLLERAHAVDRRMAEYESLVSDHDRAVRTLFSSSLTRFVVSTVVLAIAAGGAAVNFSLIARPMTELLGGADTIAGYRTADLSAGVIVLLEVTMGLLLMESLRITRLFPVLSGLADGPRRGVVAAAGLLLLSLASVEAGLAYMRGVLLQDQLTTTAFLQGTQAATTAAGFPWVATAAQMGLGFLLPLALVFVAVPLEAFAHSLRTVVGILGVGVLRGVALVLRLASSALRLLGRLLTDLYDLVIFAPLWLEERVRARRRDRAAAVSPAEQPQEEPEPGGEPAEERP